MSNIKPELYTSFSPALLNLYDVSNSIVVIIDVLRATSTIATALYNGANAVIPVDSVSRCIEISKQIQGITAGERDGKIAEGLAYGNSPFEYPREFIAGKTLVLTTTNGTNGSGAPSFSHFIAGGLTASIDHGCKGTPISYVSRLMPERSEVGAIFNASNATDEADPL